jgi:hypothetical protein
MLAAAFANMERRVGAYASRRREKRILTSPVTYVFISTSTEVRTRTGFVFIGKLLGDS